MVEISSALDDEARHAELMAALADLADPDHNPPVEPATPAVGRSLVFDGSRIALNRTQLWWKKDGAYCWSCFHELRFDLELEDPTYIKVFGTINLVHRGGSYSGPVGFGVKATVRSAPSVHDLPAIPLSSVDLPYWQAVETTRNIPGSKRAGNIASLSDHYGCADISYAILLPAGFHRIEHWGNSHVSGMPENSSYAELNQNATTDAGDPYNMLFIEGYR